MARCLIRSWEKKKEDNYMTGIKRINCNKEVWRKILNSLAVKYDCGVHFTINAGQVKFEGDRDCAEEIVKEALALFNCGG